MKHLAINAITIICLIFASHSSALGQSVVVDDNLLFSTHTGGFGFSVFQDAAATDYTGVSFNYSSSIVSLGLINLDEGSDWYVVQPGDAFSRATIAAGDFPTLVTFGPTVGQPANVGPGDFYLGVNTGLGFDIPDDRTVFGWVHLRPVFGVITMVGNAMSYDSPGIIVGTSTLVPEPSSITLSLGLCFAAFASRRTRSRRLTGKT